nr:energy transducer TonB [Brevundimonas sp. Leaf363]
MIVAGVFLAAQANADQPTDTVHRTGVVVLSCHLDLGSPRHCEVVSEDPPDAGFGEAALRSMARARFPASAYNTRRGRARFTVRFRLQDDQPSANEAARPPVNSAPLDVTPPSE